MHDHPVSRPRLRIQLCTLGIHPYNQNEIRIPNDTMITSSELPSKERSWTMVWTAFRENPCRLLRLLWLVRGRGGGCPFSTTERTLDDGNFLLSFQSKLEIVKEYLFFRPSRIRATYGI
jgi:hypothetical protein